MAVTMNKVNYLFLRLTIGGIHTLSFFLRGNNILSYKYS